MKIKQLRPYLMLWSTQSVSALPALILSKPNGGEAVLGIVNTGVGIATLAGSVLVTVLPVPKNRVKVISLTLLLSMSSENFLLA